jgi:hypothetical protein
MIADLVIANLLRIAREDLDGASLLAPRGNRNAAYLCEQAAENVIRAVLTSEGQHAGVRHPLGRPDPVRFSTPPRGCPRPQRRRGTTARPAVHRQFVGLDRPCLAGAHAPCSRHQDDSACLLPEGDVRAMSTPTMSVQACRRVRANS